MGSGQDHRRRPRAAARARLPRLSATSLAGLLDRLAAGYVPPADATVAELARPRREHSTGGDWPDERQRGGVVTVLPAPSGARAVVVGGTAWHVVAADVDPAWVHAQVDDHPLSAPLGARFLSALADEAGREPGCLDVVLVAPPAPGVVPQAGIPALEMPASGTTHPRVVRARAHRRDVRVWTIADGSGLLTLGRGIAGRWEVSLEVEPAARGRGLGRTLAAAAPALVPDRAPLWAQVAPANIASLRAFLGAGYRPVAAEVLFAP